MPPQREACLKINLNRIIANSNQAWGLVSLFPLDDSVPLFVDEFVPLFVLLCGFCLWLWCGVLRCDAMRCDGIFPIFAFDVCVVHESCCLDGQVTRLHFPAILPNGHLFYPSPRRPSCSVGCLPACLPV